MPVNRSTSNAAKHDGVAMRAHSSSIRIELWELIAFLREQLGTAAVSVMTGGSDRKTIARWSNEGAAPRDLDIERRVRTAYQVFQLLLDQEAPPTIRAWFLGTNPQLGDLAPVEALAKGQEREVISAGRAFAAGG